jgi:hypothetical protein
MYMYLKATATGSLSTNLDCIKLLCLAQIPSFEVKQLSNFIKDLVMQYGGRKGW